VRRLALLAVLAFARPAGAGTYAVVIGHNAPPRESRERLAPLHFADDDAARFHELFQRMHARVELLTVLDDRTQRRHPRAALQAHEPSLENLRRALSTLGEAMNQDLQRGEEIRFFLTYSGHGARSAAGEPFLTLSGGELTERVLFDEILGRLPVSYAHLVIDSCNASGVVGARGLFDREVDATAVPLRGDELAGASRLEQFPTVGVLLASTEGTASHEWSRVEGGVFTHEVLSALGGAADVNGDGAIEYSEVQAFIAAANRDLTDPRAVPDVVARPPRINRRAVLVSLRELQGGTVLRGDASALGHFHVELENGLRLLDAHLTGTLALALPADGVAYLRAGRGEARLKLGPGAAVALAQLDFREPGAASRGSIEQSFHDRLFASPFGLEYYRGFVDRTGGVPVDLAGARLAAHPPSHRLLSRSLLATSGALLASSGIAGYVAWQAHRDFEATSLQKPAQESARRYRAASAVAIGSAALAAVAASGAWYLWPRMEPGSGGTAAAAGFSLVLAGRW